jgi:hypothetical protein
MMRFLKKKKPLEFVEKFPGRSPKEKLDANLGDCSWPRIYYGLTRRLIASIGRKDLRILEIGVAYGYHARSILAIDDSFQFVGVDPYRAGYDPKDFFQSDVCSIFGLAEPQEAMDRLFDTVSSSLSTTYGNRAKLFRGTLAEYAARETQAKFDFIWVDGDHTYGAVSQDLEISLAMLANGGVIAGDDYNWPAVSEAVQEFAQSNELQLFTITNFQESNYSLFWLESSS